MNSLLLSRLIKVGPFAIAVFTMLFLASGVHFVPNGDPIGPGPPN